MNKLVLLTFIFTVTFAAIGCSGGAAPEPAPTVDKTKDATVNKKPGAAPAQTQD